MTTTTDTTLALLDLPKAPRSVVTINSEPVTIYPLFHPKTGEQCMLLRDHVGGGARGRVFWREDITAPTGRRVLYQYVDEDPVKGGDWVDDDKKVHFSYRDVYARRDGSLVEFRREIDSENQTVSAVVSRGGNSATKDAYLLKGMHWASPEEYIAMLARIEVNIRISTEQRKKRDPKRQMDNLAEVIKEAFKPLTTGGYQASVAAAEYEEQKAAADLETQKLKTKIAEDAAELTRLRVQIESDKNRKR